MSMSVPIKDCSFLPIKHLPVTALTKTLGQMTCLTSSSNGAIEQMRERHKSGLIRQYLKSSISATSGFYWTNNSGQGYLFGISSISAPFAVLEECLMLSCNNILSMSRIRQLVNRAIRPMDRGFYSNGFPHMGVECLIGQINKLLTHYGCSSGLGIHMQVSMELTITEAGVSTQPLSEPFTQYSKWVTHSWL
jgi:hypothetical protein